MDAELALAREFFSLYLPFVAVVMWAVIGIGLLAILWSLLGEFISWIRFPRLRRSRDKKNND